MSNYQLLPDEPEDLSSSHDEEAKTAKEPNFLRSASSTQTGQASTLLKVFFVLCLALTASLAAANMWASHQLAISLADVLPAPNVMQLGRADQHDGLSDHSRQKCAYCFWTPLVFPMHFMADSHGGIWY